MPGALAVDMGARTISGLAVPYGQVAVSGGRRVRYVPGWARHNGRVPLLVEHDNAARVGRSLQLTDTPAGLHVVLQVDRGPLGDHLLAEADAGRLGLSAGAPFDPRDLLLDPEDPTVRLVAVADLIEISLTRRPLFGLR